MKILAQITSTIKLRYTHLLSLLLLLTISTTHAVLLKQKPDKTQNQLLQDFIPDTYTIQNPLVALLTVSDYTSSNIPNLPLVTTDEKLLPTTFQSP